MGTNALFYRLILIFFLKKSGPEEPGRRQGWLSLSPGGDPDQAQDGRAAGAHGVPRLLPRSQARQEGQARPRPVRGAGPVRENV